jgi:hypothetical protein
MGIVSTSCVHAEFRLCRMNNHGLCRVFGLELLNKVRTCISWEVWPWSSCGLWICLLGVRSPWLWLVSLFLWAEASICLTWLPSRSRRGAIGSAHAMSPIRAMMVVRWLSYSDYMHSNGWSVLNLKGAAALLWRWCTEEAGGDQDELIQNWIPDSKAPPLFID